MNKRENIIGIFHGSTFNNKTCFKIDCYDTMLLTYVASSVCVVDSVYTSVTIISLTSE